MEAPEFPKLDIRNGVIHYKLYRQDGTLQLMETKDTLDNKFIVDWIQQFDRYTTHEEQECLKL